MLCEVPVKILFLAADPSDASRLRSQQELRDIEDRLRVAKELGKYKLEKYGSVRVGDLTQAIFNVKPHIIHFSGHGIDTAELCFENESGNTQLVKPDGLAALFKLFASQVYCIVLNACHSEIQAKAIAEHIPFVIGMNDKIGDKAAIAFAVGFYEALAANRSIEEAYDFGCVRIQLEGFPEHLKPVIYQKQSPISVPTSESNRTIANPFVPQAGRVEESRQFFGRDREIQRVFEVLNSGSSVALIGEEGIGKSSLLWAICQQAETRLQLPRQPIFLDLNEIGNESDFYAALCDKLDIPECKGYKLTRSLRPSVIPIHVNFQKRAATRQILANPDEEFPLDYTLEALDKIYDLTNGQPFLVQLVGFQLVRRYNDQVFEQQRPRDPVFGLTDVEAVINEDFFKRGRYYFDGVWGQAARGAAHQQAIIRAIALGASCTQLIAPHKEGLSLEILSHATGIDGTSLLPALQTLKRHDVIEESDGRYRIAVELFRCWVVQFSEQ